MNIRVLCFSLLILFIATPVQAAERWETYTSWSGPPHTPPDYPYFRCHYSSLGHRNPFYLDFNSREYGTTTCPSTVKYDENSGRVILPDYFRKK